MGQQPTGKDVSLTATWIYPIEEPDVEDALFFLKKTAWPAGQQPTRRDVSLKAPWNHPYEESDVEEDIF